MFKASAIRLNLEKVKYKQAINHEGNFEKFRLKSSDSKLRIKNLKEANLKINKKRNARVT
jgi:hypothetical protein